MGWAARANPMSGLSTKDRWLRRIAGKVKTEAQLMKALDAAPMSERDALRAALRPLLSFDLSSPLAVTPREIRQLLTLRRIERNLTR